MNKIQEMKRYGYRMNAEQGRRMTFDCQSNVYMKQLISKT